MCCRRRQLPRALPLALQRWRRFTLRKVIGNAWHWWGELLKAAKNKHLPPAAKAAAKAKAKARAKAKAEQQALMEDVFAALEQGPLLQ